MDTCPLVGMRVCGVWLCSVFWGRWVVERRRYRLILVPFVVALFFGSTATTALADTLPGATPVLDNFNRADENPLSGGGNWTSAASLSGAKLQDNAVAASVTTTSTSLWKDSYSGDVEARATILTATNNSGVYARASLNGSGQVSGYIWQWLGATSSPATFVLNRIDANTLTTLATFGGFSLDAGDQLALRVIGSSVEGWVYHLGAWQQVASATDTTYETGKIGVRPRGLTPIMDDFGGGSVQTDTTLPTVVSLTFDDEWSDQSLAPPMLAAHGMRGTFYINSGTVGSSPSFLDWNQVQSLQSAGNEVAGHTLDHVDLTSVSTTEATRQVCQDRRALMSQGLAVTDFAYPYGAYDPSIEPIIQGCGYNSARRSWGLCSPPDAVYCPAAEQLPPANVWEIRTQPSIRDYTTVDDLKSAVTNAEATGGWVTFVFHHICDGCHSYAIKQSDLQAFLDWLQPRSANGTVVKTVHDVIGGSLLPAPSVADQTAPASSIACNATACSTGWYGGAVNVTLSAVDSGTGVALIRYTTDGSSPTASSPVYSAPFTVASTATVKYRAWDKAGNIEATQSQLIQIDTTAPTSSIACNADACSSNSYPASVSVTLSAADGAGAGVAAIRYTTDGSDPGVGSTLYSDAFSLSATTSIKYRAWDHAGNVEATKLQLITIDTAPADTTAPTSSIACNAGACSTGWYAGAVSVTLSAVDPGGSGVAAIRYTTNGSDPTASSPSYTAPISVTTTTTIKFRAWDNTGNVEATKSQLVRIDGSTPQVALTSPLNGAKVSGVVKLEATATDAGSGVARVDFYVDGKVVGTATAAPYRANWNTNNKQVSKGSHTIYAVAVDGAGNAQTSASIVVTVA
jgi:peptidoglycan/xylan/chitin deacetylase (PgdA/CDA1 family)